MDSQSDDYAQRVIDAIQTAEVMSVFFVRAGHSLILDFRSGEQGEPAVLVDAMAQTPRDRLLSFGVLRPELPLPEEITLVPWAGSLREFTDVALAAAVLDRCERVGGLYLREMATASLRKLEALEQRALRAMVRGVGMATIWQRNPDAES